MKPQCDEDDEDESEKLQWHNAVLK